MNSWGGKLTTVGMARST